MNTMLLICRRFGSAALPSPGALLRILLAARTCSTICNTKTPGAPGGMIGKAEGQRSECGIQMHHCLCTVVGELRIANCCKAPIAHPLLFTMDETSFVCQRVFHQADTALKVAQSCSVANASRNAWKPL